jgi:peptide/nickel transport system permease protein
LPVLEREMSEASFFAESPEAGTTNRATLVRNLRRQKGAVIGSTILVVVILIAVLAPWIAPYDIHTQVGHPFGPPSRDHLLGLDDGGYDMVSLLMWAMRVSLVVGFAATFVSMVIGGSIGVASGYFGGKTDTILMRITDYFLVIPDVPLMIVVAAIWGPSLFHVIIVIGILLWTATARVIRAQVMSVRERVYVKRARALGAGHFRIATRHVLPQVAPLLIANTVLTVAVAIFDETALAFLGLSDPSRISLGTMIANAFERAAISAGAWWAIVPPGVLVAVIILACVLVGGALEDALNPRLRVAHLSARTFRLRPRVLVGRGKEAL